MDRASYDAFAAELHRRARGDRRAAGRSLVAPPPRTAGAALPGDAPRDEGGLRRVTWWSTPSSRRTTSHRRDAYLQGQLLTALLVGVQRHRPGEHLSGIDFVHRFALRHFLVLLARHVEAERPEVRDDLLAARVLAGPFDTGSATWQTVRRYLAGLQQVT